MIPPTESALIQDAVVAEYFWRKGIIDGMFMDDATPQEKLDELKDSFVREDRLRLESCIVKPSATAH
jgi:hypothetical protein